METIEEALMRLGKTLPAVLAMPVVLGLGICSITPHPLLSPAMSARADEGDRARVGLQPDGRIVVPTNQVLSPAGRQVTFPGRPVDLALIDAGRTLVVKNMADLVFIDVKTAQVVQTLAIDPGVDPARGVDIAEFTRHPISPSGN